MVQSGSVGEGDPVSSVGCVKRYFQTVGRGERIGVDDRSIGIQAKEFPASAIVIAGPAGVEDMGEAEEAFARCS